MSNGKSVTEDRGDEAPAAKAAPAAGVQAPSVGRIVHYTPSEDKGGKKQPRAAIITHVWGPSCVNLHVFPDGSFGLKSEDSNPTSVSLGTGPRTWNWPPRA